MAQTVQVTARGFDTLNTAQHRRSPRRPALRSPLLVLAMSWYSLLMGWAFSTSANTKGGPEPLWIMFSRCRAYFSFELSCNSASAA
jgi:hypothetical protein